MNIAQKAVRAALVAAALIASGCTYTADVRNTTSQPVFVQMIQLDPIQPDWVLATARIAPGDYARLGPKRVAFERVVIDVGNQSPRAINARERIRSGTTKLDVGQRPSEEPGRDEVIFTLERRKE